MVGFEFDKTSKYVLTWCWSADVTKQLVLYNFNIKEGLTTNKITNTKIQTRWRCFDYCFHLKGRRNIETTLQEIQRAWDLSTKTKKTFGKDKDKTIWLVERTTWKNGCWRASTAVGLLLGSHDKSAYIEYNIVFTI